MQPQALPEQDTRETEDQRWPDGVTFGFRRNPDVARNGRLGGWKRVWPIAIDYRTVAGTAGAECKGDQRSKGPDSWSPFWTPTALWRHKGKET